MKSIAVMVVVAAACGGPPEGPGDAPSDPILTKGIETQGPRLLGTLIDPLADANTYPFARPNGFAADGTPITVRFSATASLESGEHRGADPYFNDVVLVTPGGRVKLTVYDGDAELTRYRIAGAVPRSVAWLDLCENRPAIPMLGRWTADGEHIADDTALTFACEGSAVYKCLLWGYHPGSDQTSAMWRTHQACTRMVRADYCGNAKEHTFEGTTITVYDRLGVHERPQQVYPAIETWPPDATTFYHEAAWNEHHAVCVSRLRWNAIPIGSLCMGDGIEPPPCDDANLPGEEAGVLIDNTSRYDDLPLQVWSNGTDLVSTIRGSSTSPPFPGYRWLGNDALLLRASPGDPMPPGYAELCLFDNGSDHVVARCDQAELPASYANKSHEGYVPTEKLAPQFRPFVLYRNDSGDFVSTVHAQAADKLGYHSIARIGFLPPVPILPGVPSELGADP